MVSAVRCRSNRRQFDDSWVEIVTPALGGNDDGSDGRAGPMMLGWTVRWTGRRRCVIKQLPRRRRSVRVATVAARIAAATWRSVHCLRVVVGVQQTRIIMRWLWVADSFSLLFFSFYEVLVSYALFAYEYT